MDRWCWPAARSSCRCQAPPGTELKLSVGDEMTEALVPEEGVAQMRVDTEGFDDGDEVRVSLLAITPAGQGYGGAWTVVDPYPAAVAQRQHALRLARLRRRRLGPDGARSQRGGGWHARAGRSPTAGSRLP